MVLTHYLGPFTHRCPSCHALHWFAEKRSLSLSQNPQYSDCCRAGEVNIPYLHALPAQLQSLYEDNSSCACEFRSNIHQYNKALAFTSTGCTRPPVSMPPGSHGPLIYKIQGEIHHHIGPLLPEPGAAPVYSQLYVYDHANAL